MNLDAYTVRKIAPRLLLAVIAVNLSIYLCVAAIDITNVVGHGLSQLIKGPFDVGTALNVNVDEGSSNLSAFFILAGAFGATILSVVAISGGATAMIFFVLMPVIMVVLAIIVTIAIRQALLVLLTLISPVAIACLVLPGTEKYFKQWWDLFLKTLLVYPIVAALFAVSDVMASILLNASNRPGASNIQGASDIIVGVLLTVLPLFLIPFAFKFAGGAIGAIVNGASNASQPFVRLARRKRQQGLEKGWQKTRGGQMFKGAKEGSLRNRINRGAQRMAHLNEIGANPRNMRARLQNATEASSYNHMQELLKNDPYLRDFMADDDRMHAMLHGADAKGVSRELAGRGQRYKTKAMGGFVADSKGKYLRELTDSEDKKRALNNHQATQQIMEFKRRSGFDNSQGIAITALSTSATGYSSRWVDSSGGVVAGSNDYLKEKGEMEGQGHRYQTAAEQRDNDIAIASKGSLNKATALMIDSHRAAKQAGRDDLAASADAGIGTLSTIIEAQKSQGAGFNPNVQTDAMKEARDKYDTAVVRKKSMAQLANDHELSTKDAAYALDKKFEAKAAAVANAQTPEEAEAAQREWLRGIAQTMSYQDVAGNAPEASTDHLSPLMSKEYGGKTMGAEIARIRNAATPVSTKGNDGKELPAPEADRIRAQSVRDKADAAIVSEYRREYGSESALASEAQQRYMAENAAKIAEQAKNTADADKS